MPIYWPNDILVPRNISVSLLSATVKGNPSLSGVTQRSASDAGRWRISMTGIPVATDTKIKLWRAIENLVEGQLGQIVIGINDLERSPTPLGFEDPIPFSDGSLFSDGSGLSQTMYAAQLGAAASLGATEVTIDVINGALPDAGQFFSLGVHLYMIKRIVSSTATSVTVKISPPLRLAAAENDVTDFTRPKLLCRLASDDAMALPPLDFGRWTYADLELIEDAGEPL